MAEIDRVFWEKAQENLEAAQSEFINDRYNTCASRAYYGLVQEQLPHFTIGYNESHGVVRNRGARDDRT